MTDPWSCADYRELLRAWMADRPKQRSTRAVARRVGSSPARVSMICAGERSLSLEEAGPWGRALGFEPEVGDAFEVMVRAAHAPSAELRREAHREWRARVEARRAVALESVHEVLADPVAVVVVELARMPGFRCDAARVASRLWPAVSEDAAALALARLRRAGVLRVDGDAVSVDERSLATAAEVVEPGASRAALEQHAEALRIALRALVEGDADRRSVSSLTVAVPAAKALLIPDTLNQTLLSVLEGEPRDQQPDQVVQVVISVTVRASAP